MSANEQIAREAALRLGPESDPSFEYHIEVILAAIEKAIRETTKP